LLGLEFRAQFEVCRIRCPSIAYDPEVEGAFLLVVPLFGGECFEALYPGFDVVCLRLKSYRLRQVKTPRYTHALLRVASLEWSILPRREIFRELPALP
jgi:hypothetical protein